MAHDSLSIDVNFQEQWSQDILGKFGVNRATKSPFQVHIFPNFVKDAKVVNQLRDDISSSIKLKPKDNDLYKFKQSKDLKTEIPSKKLTPLLHEMVDVMLGQVRQHLEKVSGIKLSDRYFDITASRYDYGNYLLCHNDDIKDSSKKHARALAYIYYLNSRPWTPEDGGALILYNSDSTGEPVKINNSILPKPNTLIVFPATPTSWHSVQEVYCKNDFRLSINGWFHADSSTTSNLNDSFSIEPCPYNFLRPISLDDRVEKFFKECFNQEYLMEKTCLLIRKRFKKKSEINLTDFLVREKFLEISGALKEAVTKEENLTHVGPYNKRNYKLLKLDKLPPICKDLYDAFRSELFFMLLSRLTGLDLQPPSLKYGGNESITQANESSSQDEEDDDDEDDDDSDDSDDEDEGDEDEEDDEDEDEESDEEVEYKPSGEKIEPQADAESILNIVKQKLGAEDELSKANVNPTTSKSAQSGSTTQEEPKRKRKRTSNPLARAEFRHLEAGSYTLIHDYGYELGEKSALDVILHFNHDFEVNFDDGGYISYIDGAPEEDLHDMEYELLTVEPKSNCLSLVYRCDEGTCRFLKHISKSHKANYQDLYCVYYERPDDLPNFDINTVE